MAFDKGRDRAEELKAEAALEQTAVELTALELERRRQDLEERRIAAQEKLLEVQMSQANSLATQVERTSPKENPHYKPAGPFHDPEGRDWNTHLKCAIYDGPAHLNKHPLCEAEIIALNRLMPLEKGLITKADRSQVKVSVIPTYDVHDRLTKLEIKRPMGKDDNAQHYPPLDDMANQLADQALAVTA